MHPQRLKTLFTAVFTGLLYGSLCLAASPVDEGQFAISRLHDLKKNNHSMQKELAARTEFFDRLIFQINSKYKGGSLPEFLSETLTRMADRQLSAPTYDFLIQAGRLLKMRQEKHENPIDLINRFIQAGGILSPLTADQFLAAQAYSNSERGESATGMDREQLGDFIDQSELPRSSLVPVLKNVEILE